MVKFKKLLEEKTKENNGKYTYINYKKLKRIINETYIKLRITKGSIININPNKTMCSNFLSIFTMKRLNDGEYSSKINDLQDFTKNALVKDFFIELNKEINSLYKFYSREEIAISNELNQLFLNKKFDNTNDSLTTIDDDAQKLYLISLKIKLLYECLILNFEAIRKICKKFDKKLKTFLNNNSFCIYYIKALIDYHNSDLSYLLKMQIIEQGLILIQNRVGYITYRKNTLLKDPQKRNKLANVEYSGELTENDLIKEINDNLEKSNDIIEGMITNEKYTIFNINLGLILKYDEEIQNNNESNYKGEEEENDERLSIAKDDYAIDYDNEHINALLKKEESLSIARMFINKEVYQNIINVFFYYLNDLNYKNIILLFFHFFFEYLLLGTSSIQIIFILLFSEEKQIKYYGLFMGIIFFSQFLTNKILSNVKLANIKLKFWVCITSIIAILLQLSYLYIIKQIEENNMNKITFYIWSISFSVLVGVIIANKVSYRYLISCVPKNTLLMLSKNLTFFSGIFLAIGIASFYLFNKYFCFVIIIKFSLISILFLCLFTEKNSENFYKYKTNFNELSEKIILFNNSGIIIHRAQSIHFNDDDEIFGRFGPREVRESVVFEDLKEIDKIRLEKANREFNELNKKSNFNISNVVPERTKFIIQNLTNGTRKVRILFFFFFQFLSVFYKQALFSITLINYIKNAKKSNDVDTDDIEDIYIFKIRAYDIIVIMVLPLGYLLYKSFNRYNRIQSIFRFYFIINCLIFFILTFQYDSNYLLLFFMIFISFNYVMDSKINLFFAVNYRNESTIFGTKVNKLINLAYCFGKICGSLSFYFFFNREFYFLLVATLIYFAASFYDRFIILSKIIILGRTYSKEIN